MKLKVVHVVEALGGGVYTYFKDLTHYFGSLEDIETYVIYCDKRKEIIAADIPKDMSSNVKLIYLEMSSELSPIKDLKSSIQLRKVFDEIKPDIIHLHSSKAGVIGRLANFFRKGNSKVFYTPHGYAFNRQDISPLKRKIFYGIEYLTLKVFGGTTIACGDTEFEIAKKMGAAELVRNGIDFNKVSSYYHTSNTKSLTFGIVGRITFAKNPALFNTIALMFPQYTFIWIGDGELNELITAPNIQITGWFHGSTEVYAWINRIDVFLQTSLWEGLPIAVLEGMALRKPIVATNVIGNKDIVIPGFNGFLFDHPDELFTYFKKLENSVFRDELGNNAFNDCKDRFDKDKNLTQLPRVYQR